MGKVGSQHQGRYVCDVTGKVVRHCGCEFFVICGCSNGHDSNAHNPDNYSHPGGLSVRSGLLPCVQP